MGDFDEYEYLEKAVDEGPPGVHGANGKDYDEQNQQEPPPGRSRGQGFGGEYYPGEEEDELDEGQRRKRPRSEERSRSRRDEGERSFERENVRERSRERSRERERDRDRGERRHKSRERERDRDSVREYRGRERDWGGHHERGGGRYRERDFHDRRGRGDHGDHGYRGRREKKEQEEPEADPERDQRTVFAYQINLKADERDVYEFFSQAGKVRDVRLIMDRNSRRSKGVGYIEFYEVLSVPMAIALSGQLLLGTPVMVKPSEAEKNLAAQNPVPVVPGMPSLPGVPGPGFLLPSLAGGSKRLHVGNLHVNMNEEQLRQVFEPFGTLESVHVPTEPSGQCKGFGYVQYTRVEDARVAQQHLNNLEVAGLEIKVTFVPEGYGVPDAGPPVNPGELDDDEGGGLSLNAQSRAALMQKLDRTSTAGTAAAVMPASTHAAMTPAAGPGLGLLAANPLAAIAGLRPGLLGSVGLSGLGAAPGLAAGLAGAGLPGMLPGLAGVVPGMLPGTMPAAPGAAAPATPAADAAAENIGTPSEYLLLKNMWDPKEELDEEFWEDIKDDVHDECSKSGTVRKVYVDRGSSGCVYVKFADVDAASKARQTLHGRWFAGNAISATFLDPAEYEKKVAE